MENNTKFILSDNLEMLDFTFHDIKIFYYYL